MNILFENKPKNSENKYGKYGAAKRRIAIWQWYIIVLILVSPILFIFYKIITANFDDTFRGFVNFNIVKIISPENAYMVKQNIHIGSKVKKGEELIVLDSELYKQKLKSLEDRLTFLEDRKKKTVNQNTSVYKNFMQETNKYLDSTGQYVNTITGLRQRGLDTIYKLQGATMDYFDILMSKELLRYNRFYYQAEVTRLGQEIIDTNLEISTIREKQKEFKIFSPINGEVVETSTFENEYIPKNKLMAQLADYDTMYVKAYMPPKIIDSGEPLEGRKVTIYFGERLKHKVKVKGTIVGFPAMAENNEKIIQTEERNTLLYIKIDEPVPKNYYSLGYPVKVRLNND